MFSCEFCEIFKNTFFMEHLRVTASDTSVIKEHNYVRYSRNTTTSQLRQILTTFKIKLNINNNDNTEEHPGPPQTEDWTLCNNSQQLFVNINLLLRYLQ